MSCVTGTEVDACQLNWWQMKFHESWEMRLGHRIGSLISTFVAFTKLGEVLFLPIILVHIKIVIILRTIQEQKLEGHQSKG